jgi:hypothetical protein
MPLLDELATALSRGAPIAATVRRGLESAVVASRELWRQDDRGTEFRVREFEERVAAEHARDELIARGHHQHYWVVPSGVDDDAVDE